jgi:hypothetical protein
MRATDEKAAEAVAAFERALGIYEILIGRFNDPQARLNSVVPLWRLGGLKGNPGDPCRVARREPPRRAPDDVDPSNRGADRGA